MKDTERKQRFALTLLFAVIIFIVLLVSVGIAAVALYILAHFGVVTGAEGEELEIVTVLMFMAGVSLVIGTVLALLTGRITLVPVNRLISQMNRLASGDFKARLEYGWLLGKHSTFVEITDSFNRMAQELENTEMLRSDFVNNFSHEFKTPIVSIAGFAKLLRREGLSEEQKREYLAIIEEESLRLSDMATNVLELTKVENQTILNDITTYNLSEQLRYCVLLLEEKWSAKDMSLDLEFDEYEISADEELLKHVWINLLDNAIKFSPPTGEILLRAGKKGDCVYVSVTNYGSDIPPEKQEHIFQKFYQGDESHSAVGNGIGLAVVKGIVQLHKGRVEVFSENGVTTFTVSLPQTQ